MLGVLTLPALSGQEAKHTEVGVAADWSHRHLIFSQPATPKQARRVQQDPRFWQQSDRSQTRKRQSVLEAEAGLPDGVHFGTGENNGSGRAPLQTQGDWSENLGMNATVGAVNFPAKYSFSLTTANCASSGKPDFVVYSTGLAGASAQATIVAYDNIYSGCTGTVPTVYWAYNTGTGAQILTSPAFSRDGKQVVFVQSNSGAGVLVLLKWSATSGGTVSSPAPITTVSRSAYHSCTVPCMTTINLRDSMGVQTDDTTSSVFPDLSNNIGWVGGAGGWLHKITGLFSGTPAEVRNGVFPVQVNPDDPNILTSPVHDFASGNVYVGDAGGFIYAVDSTNGTVTQSGQLDFGVGLVEGPVVDSTAELVYVFASSDGSGSCSGGADCTALYELSTGFLAGDTGSETIVGNSTISGNPPNPLYLGAFDSTYLNSINATGNIYVCGNTGGQPTLYQVPVTASALGTPIAGPVLSTTGTTPACSPVTDIYNPNTSGSPTEFLFASAQNDGTSTACAAGGCIFNFVDTPWKANTAYSVGQEVIDTHFQIQVVNHAGTSGASSPPWTVAVGSSTVDGGVRWTNQGVTSATTPAAWQPLIHYNRGVKILDSNGNIELVTTAGNSGMSAPVWATTAGDVTHDGTVRWTNIGAIATNALPEAGGTSGIVIDNTVGSGTLGGASQIYFSTLGNQACGTSGTGGCAVQASQQALQ